MMGYNFLLNCCMKNAGYSATGCVFAVQRNSFRAMRAKKAGPNFLVIGLPQIPTFKKNIV